MNSQTLRQRRRRVALDQPKARTAPESGRTPPFEGPPPKRPVISRPYTEGACRSHQLKTTDLIPKRWFPLMAIAFSLAAAIAALNALHHYAPQLRVAVGDDGVNAILLDSRGGIGMWLVNLLLLMTGIVCLQIYGLRQHRRDDYRGSYRFWLWAAVLCVFGSLVVVTRVHDLVGNLWTGAFGQLAPTVNTLLVAKQLLLLGLVIRAAIEIRRSRLASAMFVPVPLLLGAAIIVSEYPQVFAAARPFVQAPESNGLLAGCAFLFFAVVVFARHVYLEANSPGGAVTKRPMVKVTKSRWLRVPGRRNATETDESGAVDKSSRKPKRPPEVRRNRVDADIDAESANQADSGIDVRRRGKARKNSESEPVATDPGTTPASGRGEAKKGPGRSMRDIVAEKQAARSSRTFIDDTDDETPDDETGISKSERRRLRKLRNREQRRAA